jgi:hypothetical protein
MAAALTLPAASTVRAIAEVAGLDVASTHRSLKRLAMARLWSASRRTIDRVGAFEFLVHAVKYLYPAALGPVDRGRPAAWAQAPLNRRLAPSGNDPVWPDALGTARGPSLAPLHRSLVTREPAQEEFAELVSLIDALRAGDSRIRGLAIEELRARLIESTEPG